MLRVAKVLLKIAKQILRFAFNVESLLEVKKLFDSLTPESTKDDLELKLKSLRMQELKDGMKWLEIEIAKIRDKKDMELKILQLTRLFEKNDLENFIKTFQELSEQEKKILIIVLANMLEELKPKAQSPVGQVQEKIKQRELQKYGPPKTKKYSPPTSYSISKPMQKTPGQAEKELFGQ